MNRFLHWFWTVNPILISAKISKQRASKITISLSYSDISIYFCKRTKLLLHRMCFCLLEYYDSYCPRSPIMICLLFSWIFTGRLLGPNCEIWNLNPSHIISMEIQCGFGLSLHNG